MCKEILNLIMHKPHLKKRLKVQLKIYFWEQVAVLQIEYLVIVTEFNVWAAQQSLFFIFWFSTSLNDIF